ncbi:phage tail protein [Actinobacillus pleuropneumoniae]|uniref:phage tail protein n=1 Tax=Actinobacillus pleuropneumoniae TaxID=715 RepID=UPI001A99FE54|nr:phage tail protein [Actinobacillus pleuropneumoniae]
MTVKVSGLSEISRNLERVVNQKLPNAVSRSLNTIARKAMSSATKEVAKDIGVPQKTIRSRSKITKANKSRQMANIRVIRSNMPAIRLFENRSNRMWVGRGAIIVGKYAIQRGFIQRLKTGRTHIMQRRGRERYSIDVVKIPLARPLTSSYEKQLNNYPEQIKTELTKNLMVALK